MLLHAEERNPIIFYKAFDKNLFAVLRNKNLWITKKKFVLITLFINLNSLNIPYTAIFVYLYIRKNNNLKIWYLK